MNKYDIILDSIYYDIVNSISNFNKITDLYINQDFYKIQTNDTRLIDKEKKDHIKCYVSQQKGFVKFINKKEIKKDISKFKVITARAAFCANSSFGNTFIGKPDEVHTKSYISFNVNSEDEAISLLSYMKCKLPNLLLSLRKSSIDISESTCKWIPLPPLNKIWKDKDVYKYFNISKENIDFINKLNINGYKNI